MATFDYPSMQQTALGLVVKFGVSTTIKRISSDYDPIEGESSNAVIDSTPAKVVTLPASSGTVQAFDDRYREDLITGRLRFFIVAAKGLTMTPEPGDLIEFEGKLWDITGSTPTNPAGVPLIYNIGARESGKSAVFLGDGEGGLNG